MHTARRRNNFRGIENSPISRQTTVGDFHDPPASSTRPDRGIFPHAAFGRAVDKAHHAAAGAGISILVTEITGSPLKGCAAALAAGLAKEAWDSTGRGNVEAADVAATVLGCGVTWRF